MGTYCGETAQYGAAHRGTLKADVIHYLTGQTVLAVAGVNSLTQLELILPQLHEQGVERIMTAFDMDFMENPHVQGGYRTLVSLLSDAGFRYGTYLWVLDIKVLMIMFGSTASNGNYLSEKGRFSFGCTVLFSFLRYLIFNVPTESQ